MMFRKTLVVTTMALVMAMSIASATPAEAQRETRRETARSERGWIGITYRPVAASGWIAIERVARESPAQAAGITSGDTIVRWNGRNDPVAASSEKTLRPGETVRVRVRRDGRERDHRITAVERPNGMQRVFEIRTREGEEPIVIRYPGGHFEGLPEGVRIRMDSLQIHADSLHRRLRVMIGDSLATALRELEGTREIRLRAVEDLGKHLEQLGEIDFEVHRLGAGVGLGARSVAGAEFTEMNDGLSNYFGVSEGVLATRVADGTPAFRSGLRSGDVIVSAGGEPVRTIRDLRRAVTRASERDIELVVVRRGERQGLRLRWE